jgi:predicted lysophospholipase L1 biosynthesis ABC-type transport system permease subunit
MKNKMVLGAVVLVVALVIGQVLTFLINATFYQDYLRALPKVLAQIAFWGPVMAIIAGGFILITLRLLGFNSLDEIRAESVEQNNPTPAIVFVGTLIASLLFLSLVIRP